MEKESIEDYPIAIEKSNLDVFGSISEIMEEAKANTNKLEDDGKIHSSDDLVNKKNILTQGLMKKNNLKEFKKYVDNSAEIKNNADYILYDYDFDLQVYTPDYQKVNPSEYTSDSSNRLFNELDSRKKEIENNYTILAGRLPQNNNEVVLVLNDKTRLPDSFLYSLNIRDRKELKGDYEKHRKDDTYTVESKSYEYSDFLDKSYKLILNTDYYKEESGKFIDYSNDYEYMKNKIGQGIDLKIVGVIFNDKEVSSYIGYKHGLTIQIMNEINKTSIYKKQMENTTVNVLTGNEFDEVSDTYDDLVKKLGLYNENEPSKISIYPKDFESKEKIVKEIEKYNKEKKDNKQNDLVIRYSDVMKSVVEGIKKAVNMVSYVLIGFVAISLIVSSIMISIITYISVLERTKEIGILRAIGASKKDIKRVFSAETIIEGFIAGALGVGITLLLSIPINAIVNATAKVKGIASLPFLSAILLILLSIVLNVLAGAKPASMAAKKDPVESLRSE